MTSKDSDSTVPVHSRNAKSRLPPDSAQLVAEKAVADRSGDGLADRPSDVVGEAGEAEVVGEGGDDLLMVVAGDPCATRSGRPPEAHRARSRQWWRSRLGRG